jgi:hypothetical protein
MEPDPPNLQETSFTREKRQPKDVDLSKLDRDISVRRQAGQKR